MPLDINDPFLEGSIRNIIKEEIGTLPALVRQLQGFRAMFPTRFDSGANSMTFSAATEQVVAVSHDLGSAPTGVLVTVGPGSLGTFYAPRTETWTSSAFTVRLTTTGVVTGSQAFAWVAWT